MTKEEKRKMDREVKEKKKIEADLEPERIMKLEMEESRKKIFGNNMMFERVRGYVLVEGKEEE
jgi:hypothetical protein